MSSDYTTIPIKETTKPHFESVKEIVEKELGKEPTNDETVRELVEAYTGHNGCGQWQKNE